MDFFNGFEARLEIYGTSARLFYYPKPQTPNSPQILKPQNKKRSPLEISMIIEAPAPAQVVKTTPLPLVHLGMQLNVETKQRPN